MHYLIDDPALASRTPGEELAIAASRSGTGVVATTVHEPLARHFPLASTRPRPPIRDLLKSATLTDESVSFVQERQALAHVTTRDTAYAGTPEAHQQPRAVKAALTTVSVRVPLPDQICRDPALLARFFDHRVIVRLCTVENDVLLHGSADGAVTGLLRLPGLRHLRGRPDLLGSIMAAAADVEDQGGSCDALVMHPRVYWQLVALGALPTLDAAGLRITRTRMIAPEQVLLGDFRAGVTLLDGTSSTLTLRRGDELAEIEAGGRIGLAVHLPQHFALLTLAPESVPAPIETLTTAEASAEGGATS
ncbi:family 3 encapsulin nanocompartment shell protein [Streptomyces odontomachi]|uniref:family 3 encapsulin nanocompartment shell protein n=1 Tax=Streptomyces odontomachi TaxID=2944940 RepID=UPI00210EC060|nr:family 3 encapsulin nanocompartment shell protein [Streptomyces sp. ODS25]